MSVTGNSLPTAPAIGISYKGFEPMEAQTRAVAKHLDHLERDFGRLVSCNIVITAPGRHHRSGRLFEISIRARLPGDKEVDITRPPKEDPRYEDFYFALNDSFKRAQRQLKNKASKLRGDVKVHQKPSSESV
jgi:hypothetical protein